MSDFSFLNFLPKTGLEPARALGSIAFRAIASTSSATRALVFFASFNSRSRERPILLRTTGLEPAQGFPYMPLKHACLPFHHVRRKGFGREIVGIRVLAFFAGSI